MKAWAIYRDGKPVLIRMVGQYEVFHTRHDARYFAKCHKGAQVQRVEIVAIPNAGNRKSA